jgi:hypothetical protein
VKSETENAERSTPNVQRPIQILISMVGVGRWMFSAIMKIVISPSAVAVTIKVRHKG